MDLTCGRLGWKGWVVPGCWAKDPGTLGGFWPAVSEGAFPPWEREGGLPPCSAWWFSIIQILINKSTNIF